MKNKKSYKKMPEKFWEKYEKLEDISDGNSKTKTYSARINAIVKEIKSKDKDDYIRISQRIQQFKHKMKVNEMMEENDTIYIVLDKNEELAKVDELLFSEKSDIEKDGIVDGHDSPIKKNEIFELFKMEKSICKIKSTNKEEKNNRFWLLL